MNILGLILGILGLSSGNHVLMINRTGLKMVRIEISGRRFEEVDSKVEKILVSVTPEKHDLLVVFKGGADVHWPEFDFKGVHEIIFYRTHHEIRAHPE